MTPRGPSRDPSATASGAFGYFVRTIFISRSTVRQE
jgi:hypothetical protein